LVPVLLRPSATGSNRFVLARMRAAYLCSVFDFVDPLTALMDGVNEAFSHYPLLVRKRRLSSRPWSSPIRAF
jgi:hypothetical protein